MACVNGIVNCNKKESDSKMNIQNGTQVIGFWGAMVPESHGVVSSMQETAQGTDVDILWDNGSVHHIMLDDIRNDYEGQLYGNELIPLTNGFFIDPFAEELM